MDLGDVLMMLVGGTIVGLIGKAVAPGERRNIPLWLTVICGMAGIIVGTYLYIDVLQYNDTTPGVDWWRHVWQIGSAAVLVMIAAATKGRRRA